MQNLHDAADKFEVTAGRVEPIGNVVIASPVARLSLALRSLTRASGEQFPAEVLRQKVE